MPWSAAVFLVNGDEVELERRLAKRKGSDQLSEATRSRYRNAGVPIQEVGPELMEWWNRKVGPESGAVLAKIRKERDAFAAELQELRRLAQAMLAGKKGKRSRGDPGSSSVVP
jgi:hypothetical protein